MRLAQLQPYLVIVDAESDARDAPEHVDMAASDAARTIVMFTNDGDTSHVKDAPVYIVAVLAPQHIRLILKVALARITRSSVTSAAGVNKSDTWWH